MGEGRTPPLPGHSQRRGQAGNRTTRPSENSTSRHAWGLRLRLGDLPDFGEALAVRAAVMLKIERNMLFLPFGAGVAAPLFAMGLHSGGPFDSYEYTSFTGVSQAPDEILFEIGNLSFYGLVRLCGRLVESSLPPARCHRIRFARHHSEPFGERTDLGFSDFPLGLEQIRIIVDPVL